VIGVSIRRWSVDDAPALFEAVRESIAEVSPWLPWCHEGYSMGEAETWLEGRERAWSCAEEYSFAIVDPAGLLLGGCGLNAIHPLHRTANLGYWVRTAAAGRGVAPRAVRRLAEWAFRESDLGRLEILVDRDNARSARVAEKAGAVREGIARGRLLIGGERRDAMVFSLLRGDLGSSSA